MGGVGVVEFRPHVFTERFDGRGKRDVAALTERTLVRVSEDVIRVENGR